MAQKGDAVNLRRGAPKVREAGNERRATRRILRRADLGTRERGRASTTGTSSSSIPKFCPALLRASGLRWPLPNWPRVVDHSCDFFRPVESQLAGNACCE